ncbi:MAG: hypothetical protein ABUS47_05090 [Steroidobacter sp.]
MSGTSVTAVPPAVAKVAIWFRKSKWGIYRDVFKQNASPSSALG